jgi:antitoxin MazE
MSQEPLVRVAKWGNSLAVRLPKVLVETLGLKDGDEVDLTLLADGTIGVEKPHRSAEFLKAMEQVDWPVPADYKFDRDEANER